MKFLTKFNNSKNRPFFRLPTRSVMHFPHFSLSISLAQTCSDNREQKPNSFETLSHSLFLLPSWSSQIIIFFDFFTHTGKANRFFCFAINPSMYIFERQGIMLVFVCELLFYMGTEKSSSLPFLVFASVAIQNRQTIIHFPLAMAN